MLRKYHRLFETKFTTWCDLVFPLSISSILSFPYGQPVAVYVFFLVFPSCIPLLLSHSIMCFIKQFLRKMWPVKLPFLLSILCRIFPSSLTLCKLPHFSRSVQLIISTILQCHTSKLYEYFWLLSELSNFQHHTLLFSKYSTSLRSSFNLMFAGEKSLLPVECCFCHVTPGFNFTRTSCIICYHATQTVEIFHIIHLFLIHHHL